MNSRTSLGAAFRLMQQSAQLMSGLLPGDEMQEARNKLGAFRLVAQVDGYLKLRVDLMPLPALGIPGAGAAALAEGLCTGRGRTLLRELCRAGEVVTRVAGRR